MSIGALDVATAMLGLALILAVGRSLRGPSLPDRVVALELISMISVSILMVRVVETGADYLLDVAIVLALVAFLGSVGLASYLERRSPE